MEYEDYEDAYGDWCYVGNWGDVDVIEYDNDGSYDFDFISDYLWNSYIELKHNKI